MSAIHACQNHRVQLIDQDERHRSPLDDCIVASRKGREFLARCLEPGLQRVLLERYDTHIHKQTSVAVFRERSQSFSINPLYTQDSLERYHEGVCQPLRQLVEWLDVLR